MDSAGILEVVNTFCSPPERASSIAHSLLQLLQSRNAPVTGLRADIFYPFKIDDCPWCVVEWTEGDNAEVMTIFQIDEKLGICSFLMHRGEGIIIQETAGLRWANCSMTWRIAGVGDLKRLFGAAQHILGMLNWSIGDIVKLYCESNPEEGSDETYFRPFEPELN